MQVIKYVGLAHERVITADDWKRAGVSDMGTVSWNHLNNHSVPIDDFTDDALRVAIEPDQSFVVVGGDNPRELMKPHAQPVTPQQADNPVDMSVVTSGAVRGSTAGSGPSPVGAPTIRPPTSGTGSGSD